MAYYTNNIPEIITGCIVVVTMLFSWFILSNSNFKLRHIEIAIRRKFDYLPRPIVKILFYLSLLVLISPIVVIPFFSFFSWENLFRHSFNISIGLGIILFIAYMGVIGVLSWQKSNWHTNWLHVICFFCFVGGILCFAVTYDYLDERFDYETHTVIFFVGSLVFMVLFIYSLSARCALDLSQLYNNFLLYYENQLKERPIPVQTEERKIPISANFQNADKISIDPSDTPERSPFENIGSPESKPENFTSQMNNDIDEHSAKQERPSKMDDPSFSNPIPTVKVEGEDKRSEVNMIDMSQVLSKASIHSGEKSHSGNIPQAFPGVQMNLEPAAEFIITPPPLPAEVRYKQEFKEILEMTTGFAKTYETVKCLAYLILCAAMYILYTAEYSKNNTNKAYSLSGLVQMLFLVYFDFLIILWGRSGMRNLQISITKMSMLMLLVRICLSISLLYWVYFHCIIYIVLFSIIGTSVCSY